eukprot:TRINITY_DN12380_c0_g1_i3.p1 TRINITY_DN12380_c0_g1~~TRINITY_DN12380_c0_g1_i3.p1  ORF type:complete len:256 (+),score=20.60 TRINITY_DN12380_c0_g1_i3:114-881(+)
MAEADRFDPELLRNLVASLNDPSLHEIAAVFCHACIVHHGWRHHDDVDTSEAHPALGANFKTAEGFQATYVKDETEALLKAIPMDELLLVHFQMNDQDVKLVEIDVHRLLNSGANLNNADLLFRLDTFNIACAVAQQLGLKATSSSPAQKQSQQTAQRHQPDAASSKPARPARSEDNRPSRLMDSRQSARNPYAIGEGRARIACLGIVIENTTLVIGIYHAQVTSIHFVSDPWLGVVCMSDQTIQCLLVGVASAE